MRGCRADAPRHWSALAHKAARAGTCDSLSATVAGAPAGSLLASAPSLSRAPGRCGRCPGACPLAARPGKASGRHSAAAPARFCVRVQPGTSALSTVVKHASVGVGLCCRLPHCCAPYSNPYLRCANDSCARRKSESRAHRPLGSCPRVWASSRPRTLLRGLPLQAKLQPTAAAEASSVGNHGALHAATLLVPGVCSHSVALDVLTQRGLGLRGCHPCAGQWGGAAKERRPLGC